MDHIIELGSELLYMHYLDSIKPEFEFNVSLKSIFSMASLGTYLADPGHSVK
jgi:hypothetical protein